MQLHVLIDILCTLILDCDVTTACISHTGRDGDVLEVETADAACYLEHIALTNTVIDARSTELSGKVIIRGDSVGDNGSLTVLTYERDVRAVDVGNRIRTVTIKVNSTVIAILVSVVLHGTSRQLICAFLHEDAIACILVGTLVSIRDCSNQLIDSRNDCIIHALSHCRLAHRLETDSDSLGDKVASEVTDGVCRHGEGVIGSIFQTLIAEGNGLSAYCWLKAQRIE